MLWAPSTRNSQVYNLDHDSISCVITEKQSTQTSSQSININKKIIVKKSIQQLLNQIRLYQPISDKIDLIQLNSSQFVQKKKYRQCIYYGQIQNSIRQGIGIMIYTNGRVYEGQWHNNYKSGKGFQKFNNGSQYCGDYFKGKPHGSGKYEWENGQIYEGEWNQGLKNGSGIWRGSKGDSYIGEWKNGKAEGYGVHTWINGNRYQGQFKECLKHGEGVDKFSNGDTYKGAYQNGKPHGYGEYYWANGSFYKGQFENGLRNGRGVWKKSNEANAEMYEGEFKDQKKQGYGVFSWSNGSKYIGNFSNDLRQGFGEMYWVDGTTYKGEWKDGQQVQQITNDINFNLGEYFVSQQLSNEQKMQNESHEHQLSNPQDFSEYMSFQQPNHPEITDFKYFRNRGTANHMMKKSRLKSQQPKLASNGFIIFNNFTNEQLAFKNNKVKSSSATGLRKKLSGTSFDQKDIPYINQNSTKCRIKHSQSASDKKAMSATFYDNRNINMSSKNIPINSFKGFEYRHSTPQNSRSNIKVKPRVIQSSNGIRNCYNRDKSKFNKQVNKDMRRMCQQMEYSRNLILGEQNLFLNDKQMQINDQNDEYEKLFTRSKYKSQLF